MKKTVGFFVLAIFIFIAIFIISHSFFKSELMSHFIWDMNTFHGRFANLSAAIPKENIVGAYAFSIRDFNLHSTRTVSQNSIYYALILAFLAASNVLLKSGQFQRARKMFTYLTIFTLGIGARLFFAYHTTCNNDLVMWYSYLDILKTNGNIYKLTNYNYSPVWFLIAKAFFKLSELNPQLYFMFAVRLFLTVVDILTCVINSKCHCG